MHPYDLATARIYAPINSHWKSTILVPHQFIMDIKGKHKVDTGEIKLPSFLFCFLVRFSVFQTFWINAINNISWHRNIMLLNSKKAVTPTYSQITTTVRKNWSKLLPWKTFFNERIFFKVKQFCGVFIAIFGFNFVVQLKNYILQHFNFLDVLKIFDL